jgi:O-antigen/teichoic acid export membrane protein
MPTEVRIQTEPEQEFSLTATRTSKKMFSALLISYAGFVFGFLANILVARALGVQGKGTFSLFQVTVALLAALAGFGAGHGQMFHVMRNPDRLRHFMANGYVSAIGLTVAVAIAYLLAADSAHLAQFGWPLVAAAIALVPATSILVFQRQYFLARHEYSLSKLNLALTLTLPVVPYGVLFALGKATLVNLIVGYTITQVACCVGFAVLTHRSTLRPRTPSWEFAKESLSFGIWQYLSDIIQFLVSRVDFFLVAYFLGSAGLGIYSVAAGIAEVTSRVPRELGTVLFPAFAAGHLQKASAVSFLRLTVAVALLTAILLGVISKPVILLLFGKDFAAAVPAFRWLLPGVVAWSTLHVTWNHASANGRPGLGVPIFGAAAVLDVVLDIFLLPKIGVVGASIASTISYGFAAFLFARIFCRNEGYSMPDALVMRGRDLRNIRMLAAGTWEKAQKGVATLGDFFFAK